MVFLSSVRTYLADGVGVDTYSSRFLSFSLKGQGRVTGGILWFLKKEYSFAFIIPLINYSTQTLLINE